MMNQRVIPAFLLVCTMVIGLLAGTGCATIIPPTGGLRDSLPPILSNSFPRDSALNFSGKKLTLVFDEYIEVQNIQQQLIISPIQQINPIVLSKLKTLTVNLKDSLEENTTYSFNFGDAIKDVNEGNIKKGFTFTFSTGPYLDSLTLTGKVIIAETGNTDSTLLAILHRRDDDSAIIYSKPRYATRLNNKGQFVFKNLPAGTFYLYALKDESGMGKLLGKDQLFAFADSPVIVSKDTTEQVLFAYLENISPKSKLKVDESDKFINPLNNLQANQLDLEKDFEMEFLMPLKSYDSSKIKFSTDSSFIPVNNFKWTLDSSSSKLTLHTIWKENKEYHLILEKEFAIDTMNRKHLTTDTITFFTRKQTDYGSVKIQFKNLILTDNPVLLFLIGNAIVHSFPLKSAIFNYHLFKPGDYQIRILNDKNKNGIWDSGIFFEKHLQPEKIIPIKQKIIIKPNWVNEFEVTVPDKIK